MEELLTIAPLTMLQVLDSEHGGLKPFCSVRWSSIQVNHPVKDPAEILFAVYQAYNILLLLSLFIFSTGLLCAAGNPGILGSPVHHHHGLPEDGDEAVVGQDTRTG